ncbi:MAG TPA: hypothetical protein VEX15_20255 [Nocardioidaceae bacterium]|nr:hypothetical protein [Nocardioidaceae bacterium]
MTDAAPPPGAAGRDKAIGRAVVGAFVALVVVTGAVLWSTDARDDVPPDDVATPTVGPPVDEVDRDERASQVLQSLGVAWLHADETAFVDAAGASRAAHQWAGQVYDALADLRVRWIDLRYVAVDPETAADPLGFTADVEVRWELDAGPAHQIYRTAPVMISLRFSYNGDRIDVVGLDGDTDDPVPVWLAGPVDIESTDGGTCIAVPEGVDLDTCAALLDVAADDLANIVSTEQTANRPVVVMVPNTDSTAAMLLGQEADDLTQIAAVTTTIDGSSSVQAPAEVVVNPTVFDDLSRRAAQLVMSHEVTHAATGATASSIELWVAEGFADYVALASGRIPVERAASQILSYVRKHHPPEHLPTAQEFSAHRHGLGRTYEAAWLIFRMLGAYYGDDSVVDFYDEVRTGTPVEDALLDTIGLDLDGLTAAWQDYLTSLAFGVS